MGRGWKLPVSGREGTGTRVRTSWHLFVLSPALDRLGARVEERESTGVPSHLVGSGGRLRSWKSTGVYFGRGESSGSEGRDEGLDHSARRYRQSA